ncbi:DUF2141 domain-containing protein [Thermodesulfobacteriota bacterium]
MKSGKLKKLGVILIVVFLMGQIRSHLFASEQHDASQKGDLIIRVEGFKNNTGSVRVALVDSKKAYKGKREYFRSLEVAITDQKAEVTFKDIPFGEYAVKLYHDENDNDKLDRIVILGIPLEKYGFSNNARSAFGPPRYRKAQFTLQDPMMTMDIMVK